MCTCAGSSRPKRSTLNRFASVNIFVHLLALISITFIVLGPSVSTCIPISEFFPFNSSFKDLPTERDDDGGSGQINLTVKFPFFGRLHDKLFVNNNGIITFITGLRTYRPENFPLQENTPIIAAYWADVDTSKTGGNVWYHQYRDPEILDKAQQEIRNYLFAYRNFRAHWVFVATWDNVGFYGAKGEGLNKRNTFQVILVLDSSGKISFVILNYGKIEWTTGSNSQGDPLSGLGGDPAQAGFNAGDGKNYFEIEGARTHAILNLTATSNVGVPGKWIFRIDSADIKETCSSSGHGELFFRQAYVSMLGGESVSISGPCFSFSHSIEGRIDEIGDEKVCCYAVHSTEAKCVIPPVFKTGLLNVSLNIGNTGWNFTGQMEFKNVIDMEPGLVRHNIDAWYPGSRRRVSLRDAAFVGEDSDYLVELLEYRVTGDKPEFHPLYSKNITREDREDPMDESFYVQIPSNLDSSMTLAVVKVTTYGEDCEPFVYSDVFIIFPKSSDVLEGLCSDWLQKQPQLEPLEVDGHCPCTLLQGEGDTSQFIPDPLCNSGSDWPTNCKYRSPDAGKCLVPNRNDKTSLSYTCCYDKTSLELLNPLEGLGGGTSEQYSIRTSASSSSSSGSLVVPFFTYMQSDVCPFLQCCTYSSNQTLCDEYLKLQPPVGCQGYETPAAAQGSGDPHLDSLDGHSFTFNGVGVFTLLRVKDTDTVIQVRASVTKDIDNKPQNATVFTGIAMRASTTSSVVEITLDDSGGYMLLVDGQPFEMSTSTSTFNGITIYSADVDGNDDDDTAAASTSTSSSRPTRANSAAPQIYHPDITPSTGTPSTLPTIPTTPSSPSDPPSTDGSRVQSSIQASTGSRTTAHNRNHTPSNTLNNNTPKSTALPALTSAANASYNFTNYTTNGFWNESTPQEVTLVDTSNNNSVIQNRTDFNSMNFTAESNSRTPIPNLNVTSRHSQSPRPSSVTQGTRGRIKNPQIIGRDRGGNNGSGRFNFSNSILNGTDELFPVNDSNIRNNGNYSYNDDGWSEDSNRTTYSDKGNNRTHRHPKSNGNNNGNNNNNNGNGINNRNNNNDSNQGGVDVDEVSQRSQRSDRRRRKRRQTSGEATGSSGSTKKEITLVADSLGLSVLVEVTPDLLNVMVIAGPQLKGRVDGLLGNYNGDSTDDLQSKEGMTLSPTASMRDVHYKFGMSWNVTLNESLFSDSNELGNINADAETVGQNNKDFSPIFLDELEARGLPGNTVQICGDNVQCQFDFMVTGKESIAMSTLKFSNKFAERKKELLPVIRCPYVHSVANGNRTMQGQKVGDQVLIQCHAGFLLTNNTNAMTCMPTGKWDKTLPACVEEIDTEEDIPFLYVAVGAAAGGFLLLVFICLLISYLCRQCSQWRASKKQESWSDLDQAIELPTIFPPSDIPRAVFENEVFVSCLQKLSEKGTFRIPRPTFVDPNIYTEYF